MIPSGKGIAWSFERQRGYFSENLCRTNLKATLLGSDDDRVEPKKKMNGRNALPHHGVKASRNPHASATTVTADHSELQFYGVRDSRTA